MPHGRADGHHDCNCDGNYIAQECPFFEQTKQDRVEGEAHRKGLVRRKGIHRVTIKVIDWPDGRCVRGGLGPPMRGLRAPLSRCCSHLYCNFCNM